MNDPLRELFEVISEVLMLEIIDQSSKMRTIQHIGNIFLVFCFQCCNCIYIRRPNERRHHGRTRLGIIG